jgi:predicted transposase YbfD/YdcC
MKTFVKKTMKTSLHKGFGNLIDARVNRNKRHLLIDIVIITIIAVLCGAESWDDVELYGKTKISFLKKILCLPNGIPSHDTINRVISSIKPEYFEKCFIDWVQTLLKRDIDVNVISIDGKTVRRSKDTFHNTPAIHIVSAWSSENQMVLGQCKSEGKSNEIKTIPTLLDLLDIKGSIITIDAMGTQKDIARKIIANQADYILSLKANQKNFMEEVESVFRVQKPDSTSQSTDKAHGRIETRSCYVITDLTQIEGVEKWENMKSIIKITSERILADKTTTEERYYISSLDVSAEKFNKYIRAHWGVENNLHWVLDMTFNEDYQRKRTKNAAQNFALINKIALNLLKKDYSKGSLKAKRKKAGWDDDFLLGILKI